MSDQHLLEVRDLVVRFRTHDGAVHAVNGISFDLAAGETLGVAGESGCGKSVTNLAIVGLLPKPVGRVEGGSVKLEGRELTTLKEEELRKRDSGLATPTATSSPIARARAASCVTLR